MSMGYELTAKSAAYQYQYRELSVCFQDWGNVLGEESSLWESNSPRDEIIADLWRLIEPVLEALTARQREVVELCLLRGKSQVEAAAELDLCQPTINKTLWGNDWRAEDGTIHKHGGAIPKLRRLAEGNPEIERLLGKLRKLTPRAGAIEEPNPWEEDDWEPPVWDEAEPTRHAGRPHRKTKEIDKRIIAGWLLEGLTLKALAERLDCSASSAHRRRSETIAWLRQQADTDDWAAEVLGKVAKSKTTRKSPGKRRRPARLYTLTNEQEKALSYIMTELQEGAFKALFCEGLSQTEAGKALGRSQSVVSHGVWGEQGAVRKIEHWAEVIPCLSEMLPIQTKAA